MLLKSIIIHLTHRLLCCLILPFINGYSSKHWKSLSLHHFCDQVPWTREEKIFGLTTYLETKSFKTVLAKFCRKFNLIIPRKPNLSLGTQISSPKVSKLPQREGKNFWSGRKLNARYPDNVDAVRDSVGRSPKKSLRRCSQNLVFHVHCWIKSINFCHCHLVWPFWSDMIAF